MVLSVLQLRAGFTGSAAIWLCLFASVICGSIQFASMLEEDVFDGVSITGASLGHGVYLSDFLFQHSQEDKAYKGLFVAYYVLAVITLVAFSFSSIPVPSLLEETEQVWVEVLGFGGG